MSIPTETAYRRIVRAAGTVMFAFVISNLTGLVRMILVANRFGTGVDIDAFTVANRVSETLFSLVAGGALSSAFIPTFAGLLTKDEHQKAWRLASAVANLVLIVLIFLAVLAAIFAPQVVRYVLAPGFADKPAQEKLTIDLLRLQLPSAVLFGLSGLVMGVLNSHQSFLVPALTPSMYQIGLIFGVLVLSPDMGIRGLGWGVVIGAGLHLALQLPALLKLKGHYFTTLGLGLPEVCEVIVLMGPRLLGVAVVQLNFWVNTRLASHMLEGSVIGIQLGFALMLMPQAAIAQSIAIAAMPIFSVQVALEKLDEMRSTLAASLRGALLLAIPASIGLILLREPIIKLLYQHGEFTERSTDLVAWALLWYTAGLVGHSIVEILSRAFYSLHDTRTPVFVGAGAMSLNIVFSLLFSAWFASLGWMPHGGLALANSLATALEAVILFILMRRRLGGLNEHNILDGSWRAALAAIVMGLVLWGWMAVVFQPTWLVALGGIIAGSLVFGIAGLALKIREVESGVQLVRRKLNQIV